MDTDSGQRNDFVRGRSGAGPLLYALLVVTIVVFVLDVVAIFVGLDCDCSVANLLLVYGVSIYSTFVYASAIGATLFAHSHHFKWRQWLLYGTGLTSLYSISLLFGLVTLLVAIAGPIFCAGNTFINVTLVVLALVVFLLLFILQFGGFIRTHPGTHRQMYNSDGTAQFNYIVAKRFQHIVPRHALTGTGTVGRVLLGITALFALFISVMAAIALATLEPVIVDLHADPRADAEAHLWLGLVVLLSLWMLLSSVFVWATSRDFFGVYLFLSRPSLILIVINTFLALVGLVFAVLAAFRCVQSGFFFVISLFFLLVLVASVWLWAITSKITEATPEFNTVRQDTVSKLARQ